MSTLLLKNIEVLVTMDDQRCELKNTALFIKDGFIQAIGEEKDLPNNAD
jgi:cytosine/adenosine deaminase-related metal-dependent hydrolase